MPRIPPGLPPCANSPSRCSSMRTISPLDGGKPAGGQHGAPGGRTSWQRQGQTTLRGISGTGDGCPAASGLPLVLSLSDSQSSPATSASGPTRRTPSAAARATSAGVKPALAKSTYETAGQTPSGATSTALCFRSSKTSVPTGFTDHLHSWYETQTTTRIGAECTVGAA